MSNPDPSVPIIGWGLPLGYDSDCYHAVLGIEGGSAMTVCAGRWPATEPIHWIEGRDRELDDQGRAFKRCDACLAAVHAQRRAQGVRELQISATYARRDTMGDA